MILVSLFLSAGLSVEPSSYQGVDLWEGARAGAGVMEVQAAAPRAHPPTRPKILTDGALEKLTIDEVVQSGRRFRVGFFFDREGLKAVQLTQTNLSALSGENMAAARTIGEALSRRFGPGYDCGDRSFEGVAAYGCRWIKGEWTARMSYIDVSGDGANLSIVFRRTGDLGLVL